MKKDYYFFDSAVKYVHGKPVPVGKHKRGADKDFYIVQGAGHWTLKSNQFESMLYFMNKAEKKRNANIILVPVKSADRHDLMHLKIKVTKNIAKDKELLWLYNQAY